MSSISNNCGIQTLVIPAGSSAIIPAGATIISHDASDSSQLSSVCEAIDAQLGDAEAMECYEFAMEGGSDHGSEADSWNVAAAGIVQLEVGGQTFPIMKKLNQHPEIISTFRANVPAGIMKFQSGTDSLNYEWMVHNNRIRYTIAFKAAPSVAAMMRLKLDNDRDNEDGLPFPEYYVMARPRTVVSLPCA